MYTQTNRDIFKGHYIAYYITFVPKVYLSYNFKYKNVHADKHGLF